MAGMQNMSPIEATKSQDDVRHPVSGHVRLPRARGSQNGTDVYRNYHRSLRLKRLALAAFLTMAALFFLWIVPWVPRGLNTGDYTPQLALTIFLLIGVTFTAALAMAAQEVSRRHVVRLLAWGSVYDEATGLRNRGYLYDRLSLECERAAHSSTVFSVLVLQVLIGEAGPTLRTAAGLIERHSSRSDVVALLSGSEVAILSLGVNKEECVLLIQQLRRAVVEDLSSLSEGLAIDDVRSGGATYGVDGEQPNVLIQVARSAMSRTSNTSTKNA